MYRLAYLIPRIILLSLAFLVVAIAGDATVQTLLTAHIEASTGLDLELGRLRTRLNKGKLFASDLALVDPANPLSNIFQADLAFLEINKTALLQRQLVIENARASQVRLSVPRTSTVKDPLLRDSASAPESFDLAHSQEVIGRFDTTDVQIRNAWLDQFESNDVLTTYQQDIPRPGKLYRLASSTNEKWNRDFQQRNGQLKAVNASLVKVSNGEVSQEEINRHGLSGPVNPLRGEYDSQPQVNALDEILSTLEQLQRQQAALEEQAADDIALLDSTWQTESDALQASKAKKVQGISPETLSELLLTKLHQQIANDALEWLASVRGSVTQCDRINTVEGAKKKAVGRGEFVSIPGAHLDRRTVIRKLTFDGAGRFHQQHVNFAGEAFQISDQPAAHDQPISFKLRAQGEQHFVLNGTIDRRSGDCQDSMLIDFPEFHLGLQNLGTEEEMLVTTGPRTTVHGAIHFQTDRQNISGTMRLDFSNVALVVEHLHDVAGGKEIALRLNHALSTLQQFESTTEFVGTLANPRLKMTSNLGSAVAEAIANISQGRNDHRQANVKREVDQFYRTQVASLKTNIKSELNSITQSIDQQIRRASEMQDSLRTANSRWPNIRQKRR